MDLLFIFFLVGLSFYILLLSGLLWGFFKGMGYDLFQGK